MMNCVPGCVYVLFMCAYFTCVVCLISHDELRTRLRVCAVYVCLLHVCRLSDKSWWTAMGLFVCEDTYEHAQACCYVPFLCVSLVHSQLWKSCQCDLLACVLTVCVLCMHLNKCTPCFSIQGKWVYKTQAPFATVICEPARPFSYAFNHSHLD